MKKEFKIFVECGRIEIHFKGEWDISAQAKRLLEENKVEGISTIATNYLTNYEMIIFKAKLYSSEEVIQNIKKVLEDAGFKQIY